MAFIGDPWPTNSTGIRSTADLFLQELKGDQQKLLP
jgi:hypothetical protein